MKYFRYLGGLEDNELVTIQTLDKSNSEQLNCLLFKPIIDNIYN